MKEKTSYRKAISDITGISDNREGKELYTGWGNMNERIGSVWFR